MPKRAMFADGPEASGITWLDATALGHPVATAGAVAFLWRLGRRHRRRADELALVGSFLRDHGVADQDLHPMLADYAAFVVRTAARDPHRLDGVTVARWWAARIEAVAA